MSMKEKLNASEHKNFFCDNWETARKGLDVIKSISNNFIVRISCSLIISVGDTLHEATCPV